MPYEKLARWPRQKAKPITPAEKRLRAEAKKFHQEVAQKLTVSTDQDGPVRVRKMRPGEHW